MNVLETLLAIYILLLILNGAVAIVLWFVYRKPILLSLIGVWSFTLFNFVAQAATLHTEVGSILGFCTYIFSCWCLTHIMATVLEEKFSFRFFWITWSVALLAFAMAELLNLSFWIKSAPLACAIAAPQIFWALRALKNRSNQSTALIKLFAVVLMINGIHFLDYPFLRPIPEVAVLGYSVVIATTMLFGILLPCVINNFLSALLTQKLHNEIENRKATELELESALIAAERSAKAKTIFLANMSHEIRTPINGIIGLNDLLLESKLSDNQRTFATQVRNSSDELLNLVNNVLTLSKLECSEIPLNLTSFNVQKMIDDISNHYTTQGTGKSQLVFVNRPVNALWVSADESKAKQIVYNLINNSIRHSASQNIRCSITYQELFDNRGELQLEVSDDGHGVEKEKIGQLTHRFEQNEYSYGGGVGLGLSIVIEILGAMDGSLYLDSEIGKGFLARCTIPAATCEPGTAEIVPLPTQRLQACIPDPIDIAAEPNTAARIEAVNTQNDYFVLVVEDNPVNQMVIEGMLKKLALPYKLASNGAQFRQLYQQFTGKLACILMDIQLPDTSGLDLIREIRRTNDPVRILVISAFAFNEDEDIAMNAGADGYLRKPYHFDHFKQALTTLYQTLTPSQQTRVNL